MSKKKTAAGPDLFGSSAATVAEKPKKAVVMARNEQAASACGLIAGMPDSFSTALDRLKDITRRSEAARATTGILTPKQVEVMQRMEGEIRLITGSLDRMWGEVDAMIQAGIALPEKPKVIEEAELL